MRPLILILSLLLLGCRTQKNISTTSQTASDSISRHADTFSSSALDSLLILNRLDFDTLTFTLTKPQVTLEVKAIRGSLNSLTSHTSLNTLTQAHTDSTAQRTSSSSSSHLDRTSTTIGFSPPNGTLLILLSAAICIGIIFYKLR